MAELRDIATCKTLEHSRLCLSDISVMYFRLMHACAEMRFDNQRDADAWLTIQMLFTKTVSFIQLLSGFSFQDREVTLSPIIDPTVLFSIARDVYEAVSSFQIAFFLSKTEGQRQVAYNLYRIAGLMERQHFDFNPDNKSAQVTLDAELQDIIELKREIKHSAYYKGLSKQSKHQIMGIVNSPYPKARFIFQDGGAIPVVWEKAYNLYGIKEKAFGSLYAYLSNHVHTTYLSLTQYGMGFSKRNPQFMHFACFASRILSALLSIYIVDFCKNYPKAKEIFDMQEDRLQWIIDRINIDFRGKSYALSEKWQEI